MITSDTAESNSSKISNIYILPCLQELKLSIENSTFEPEQIPAVPSYLDNHVIKQLTSITSASDEFDKIWWGNNNNALKKKYENDYGIIIPHMNLGKEYKKYGLMSIIRTKITECRNMNIEDKWKMYIEFLNNKFAEKSADNTDANAAFIISHHNRMKEKNKMFGLIPFNESGKKYSYANNFCFKITITTANKQDQENAKSDNFVMFDIANEGFPDKDTYTYFPDTNSEEYIKIKEMKGIDYIKKINEYCEKYINLEPIRKAHEIYKLDKPLIIYLIRHGNALHNEPVKKKEIDSSLTPLGMYQAVKLSEKIKNDIGFLNITPLLCCSFLQRSQLTGLILLKKLGILHDNMLDLHKKMINIAYDRWNNADGMIARFNKFSPVSEYEYGYNEMISYLQEKYGDKQIIENATSINLTDSSEIKQIQDIVGGKKSKKNQPKRLRRKSKKHRKNKK